MSKRKAKGKKSRVVDIGVVQKPRAHILKNAKKEHAQAVENMGKRKEAVSDLDEVVMGFRNDIDGALRLVAESKAARMSGRPDPVDAPGVKLPKIGRFRRRLEEAEAERYAARIQHGKAALEERLAHETLLRAEVEEGLYQAEQARLCAEEFAVRASDKRKEQREFEEAANTAAEEAEGLKRILDGSSVETLQAS
jgi:hypothetical protein